MELKTIQEIFTEYYHKQPYSLKDRQRYENAMLKFSRAYVMKPPYTSYNAFKNRQTKQRKSG